jgi:predicted dehydrogenase
LQSFARELKLTDVPLYYSLNELFEKCQFDAAIITVPDFEHCSAAIACCEHGKHIMLEKPMAPTADECRKIINSALKNDTIVQIGFVLRNHPVFSKVIEIARSGVLGQILNIASAENISVMHGASYMRRWHRKVANSGGFMLAKCSHDIDIIATVANSQVKRVAAFGSLDHFTSDKLKHEYCSECSDQNCRYRFGGEFVRMTEEEKAAPAQKKFDLCVYNSDKDIIDHEVAIMDFANGIKASFALNLFAEVPKRTINICGTEGILYADTAEECIHIHYSNGKPYEKIECKPKDSSGHGGSDKGFLDDFVDCLINRTRPRVDYMAGLASTVIGNAIEKAMQSGTVVAIAAEEYNLEQ